MTREELIADADKAVAEFAAQLAAKPQESSGIPRPPTIDVTESQLDPTKTNVQLGGEAQTGPPPEGGGIGPPGGFIFGACCDEDGNCTIKTEAECVDDGGTWHGETDCDPNPCPPPMVTCSCGFSAFDGSGRRFLKKTVDYTISRHVTGPTCGGVHGDGEITIHDVYTYNPITCALSCVASGGGSWAIIVDATGVHFLDCTVTRSVCGLTHTERTTRNCFGGGASTGTIDQSDTAVSCGYYPTNQCINPSGTPIVTTSATTCHWDIDDGAGTVAHFTAVLTDECIPVMALGDMASAVLTPVADAFGMDCVDPETHQLKPESDCARRVQMLNEGRYMDTFYDIFWKPAAKQNV